MIKSKKIERTETLVNSYLLAQILRYNEISIKELAQVLRIDVKDVKERMKHGLWQSNELEIMLQIMDFPINPLDVFFSTYNRDEN